MELSSETDSYSTHFSSLLYLPRIPFSFCSLCSVFCCSNKYLFVIVNMLLTDNLYFLFTFKQLFPLALCFIGGCSLVGYDVCLSVRFFNSFIEIEFTYCKICLFKLYNLMVFNILTELRDHHPIQLMDIFNPQRNWPVIFLKLAFAPFEPYLSSPAWCGWQG